MILCGSIRSARCFFEELSGSKTAETVAAETGIELLALSPLEGLSDEELAAGDDYFSVMEKKFRAAAFGAWARGGIKRRTNQSAGQDETPDKSERRTG